MTPRRIVGSLIVEVDDTGRGATCGDLWVDRWHRGRGIGARLVSHAVEDADRRGILRLRANVHSRPARVSFERAGFEVTSERGITPAHVVMSRGLVC